VLARFARTDLDTAESGGLLRREAARKDNT